MNSETDVFIAYTPYQVLLSYAIASDLSTGVQYLYIIPAFDTDSAERLVELFSGTGVFDTVEQRPGKFNGGRRRPIEEQRSNIKHNISFFQKFIGKNGVRTVYASVDMKEVVQAAMSESPHNVYIEDGANAYGSNEKEWAIYRSPLKNKLIFRLQCGFWWQSVNVYGTSTYIDEVRAVFPDQIRPELANKQVQEISRDPLLQLASSPSLSNYFESFDISNGNFPQVDGILLLPHSSAIESNENQGNEFQQLVNLLEESPYQVLIKYHPRDMNPEAVFEQSKLTMPMLPSHVPVELLYIWFQDSIRLVLGEHSTAVYTAQWLCDDADVFSLGQFIETPDSALLRSFEGMGITTLKDVDELWDFI